jgi:hypothetical protein
VVGDARNDPGFIGGGDRVRYSVAIGTVSGPFTIDAELLYQPIGYRWAQNLKSYDREAEPRRFNRYFDSLQSSTALVLARNTLNTGRQP